MSTTVKENAVEIINDQVKSHANDPAVLRQVEKAKATLKRVGLPKRKISCEK